MQWVIHSSKIKQHAVMAVKQIMLEPVQVVTIKDWHIDKTSEQRKFFHMLCAIFADEIGMHSGEIKEIAKAKLAGWKTIQYGGINLVVADLSSEKLSMAKYSELIEVLYELAAESGVTLPAAVRG